jgi:hypothetical protein
MESGTIYLISLIISIILIILRFIPGFLHHKEIFDWSFLVLTSITLLLYNYFNNMSRNINISILLFIGVIIFMFSFREYYELSQGQKNIPVLLDEEKTKNKNRIYLITGLSISGISVLLFGLNYMLSKKN